MRNDRNVRIARVGVAAVLAAAALAGPPALSASEARNGIPSVLVQAPSKSKDYQAAQAALAQKFDPVEVALRLRVFEGVTVAVPAKAAAVTSSYLTFLGGKEIEAEWSAEGERRRIAAVFNLPDVRMLTETRLEWSRREDNRVYAFRIADREYLITVTPRELAFRKLTFDLKVQEKEAEMRNLLETGFSIPRDQLAVFGFADSAGTPYFLGLRVLRFSAKGADQPSFMIGADFEDKDDFARGAVRAEGNVRPPRLVKAVDPVYPEDARKRRIEGLVIMGVRTDRDGRIARVRILRSVPGLDEAAETAVKQWVYAPVIVKGKPSPAVFTVTVRFQLDGP